MSEYKHKEWEKENSLTAPSDRDPARTYKPNQSHSKLTEEEVDIAIKELDNTSFTKKFPKVERRYADPPVPLQTIGLISFVPAKGATPNKNGVYGFAKMRGNFSTELEASERAEYLIRKVDSYHQIYHAYVGRPFPLTTTSDYSAVTDEIDIKKDMTESISSNIKKKKDEEQKIVEEIKEREELLKADVDKDEEDPYESYITYRVKLAQVGYTYLETLKRLDEMKDSILKSRKVLEEMDEKYPDYKESYMDKYMNARKEAGLTEEKDDNGKNFIGFMGSDLKKELGF